MVDLKNGFYEINIGSEGVRLVFGERDLGNGGFTLEDESGNRYSEINLICRHPLSREDVMSHVSGCRARVEFVDERQTRMDSSR